MSPVRGVAGEARLAGGGVVAVGVDLASVTEVREAVRDFGDSYLKRVFSSNEVSNCVGSGDPAPQLAALFAAKEAVLKILGCEHDQPPWTSIEVCHREEGGFELRLIGSAADMATQRGIDRLAVSVSHDGDLATAVVFAMTAP
jgi:holo-[acyl-carrier protein] synthase